MNDDNNGSIALMAPSVKKGDVLELKIDKLIYGGMGLGRYNGQVIFVDYSAPGDHLEVEVFEVKKNFSKGKILRILSEGHGRTHPQCKVFGQCGGCQWQHIRYEEQVKSKQNILEEIVKRFLPNEEMQFEPFHQSSHFYHYRNRIQVRVDKEGKLGFFEKGSHNLVEIESCAIAEEPLNLEIQKMKQKKLEPGKYRLQVGLNNNLTRTFVETQEEPLGFAQINHSQNEHLQAKVLKYYSELQGYPIFDLYGGYGNLSLPLAKRYPQATVECVEWSYDSITMGLELAQEQSIHNLRFINMDVKSYLQRLHLPTESFVIIDPSRDGCDTAVIQELAIQAPRWLVSVSCDPMTWGRDLKRFLDGARQNGFKYRIATIQGLDMFPQTDHIEVFSVLERV